MTIVHDQEQRQRALNPVGSFIVQAPAGSGKTGLLIQRYLCLLARVESPEEVIAITFTRKAAAEMRGRVMHALQVDSSQVHGELEMETLELAQDVIAKDKKLGWGLIDNPSRLRIQTIDSLCAQLTRQMPIHAGFGAQPETMDDATELYMEAASNTLAELEGNGDWSEAVAVLLEQLDNDLPRVRNMLAVMLSHRDQWLGRVTRGHSRAELETAIQHLVQTELKMVCDVFPADYKAELLSLLRYAAGNLEVQNMDSDLRQFTNVEKLPGDMVDDLPAWQAITEFVFTKSDSVRKRADTRLGFPSASSVKSSQENPKAMKERYVNLLAQLADNENLVEQLLEIKYLPPVNYNENEWQLIDALYQLLILADAQLRILFSDQNKIDFNGVSLAAIQSLGTDDSPTDLALYLDYQVKHILVDEFQDISMNQYELLSGLTAGWSADDEHTLFLVGDPMQSIYRFRDAEVGVFLTVWQQQRLGQVPLEALNISVNFRSEPGIVEWVNDTFSGILPDAPDEIKGAVSYTRAIAYRESVVKNPVHVLPSISPDSEREAEIVLTTIREVKSRDPDDTIAVLVRNRSHLLDIIPRVKQAGIRFRAVEIESLANQPSIQDLLSLTLALTHFADRISWLAILRAPWCGLSLIDLEILARNAEKSSIWEAMCDDKALSGLCEEGKLRLMKMREILANSLKDRQRYRLSRWIESCWIKIGGPATLYDEADIENSTAFFQVLETCDRGGDLEDRNKFIEQINTLYAAADVKADQGLQIMTIHKAKGLEFDTVILPGLARGTAVEDPHLLSWMERPHGSHQDLLLAPVSTSTGPDSPIYHYLKRLEKQKEKHEKIRLLYVAVTRARKNLYLAGTLSPRPGTDSERLPEPQSNSLMSPIWPVVKNDFETEFNNMQHPSAALTNRPKQENYLRRISNNWKLPDPEPGIAWKPGLLSERGYLEQSSIEFEWAGETIKHIGSVVHQYIQLIADQGLDNWDQQLLRRNREKYLLALQQHGVSGMQLELACERVYEALCNTIEDARGRWILSEKHSEKFNEHAISGLFQGRIVSIIIDRTFVDENDVRWIVDYKTSRHEGQDVEYFLDQQQHRYEQQMHKYAELMSHHDDRQIQLGLYFPLLCGWREWNYQPQT